MSTRSRPYGNPYVFWLLAIVGLSTIAVITYRSAVRLPPLDSILTERDIENAANRAMRRLVSENDGADAAALEAYLSDIFYRLSTGWPELTPSNYYPFVFSEHVLLDRLFDSLAAYATNSQDKAAQARMKRLFTELRPPRESKSYEAWEYVNRSYGLVAE